MSKDQRRKALAILMLTSVPIAISFSLNIEINTTFTLASNNSLIGGIKVE